MIFDRHVFCFTAPDAPAGNASGAESLAPWQRQYASHHQPAFRVCERASVDAHRLLDPEPDNPLRLAHDSKFRVDRAFNRLVWTVDGEDYTKQQLTPNVVEFGPGAMVAETDHAGVDVGPKHADATLTEDVAYLGRCVEAFPDRLRAMAPLADALVPDPPDQPIAQAVPAIGEHRLHSRKIIPACAYQQTLSRSSIETAWCTFCDAVVALDVPVFFTLGSRPGATDRRQVFIGEVWDLRRLMDRYPTLRTTVTHGYPWRTFIEGENLAVTVSPRAPFRDTSLTLEVGFPFRIDEVFGYPYTECRPVIETMIRHIGPDRLIWGSDIPFQNRFCTYRQSRDDFEKHCAWFLSSGDLAKTIGGNITFLLRIKSSPEA